MNKISNIQKLKDFQEEFTKLVNNKSQLTGFVIFIYLFIYLFIIKLLLINY